MKEFVEYIVKNLVDRPEEVDVRCYEGENGFLVEVRVGTDEVGKVVGSRGVTISAIRTLAMTICARFGHRIRVEIIS